MNVRRGFFRLWVAMSVTWIWCVAVTGFFFLPKQVESERYQYVHMFKKGVELDETGFPKYWERDLLSPRDTKEKPAFSGIGWEFVNDWEDRARKGTMLVYKDAGRLFLPVAITPSDREYLRAEFSKQKWERWGRGLLPWLATMFAPPVVLLILGVVIGWVVRGFARA